MISSVDIRDCVFLECKLVWVYNGLRFSLIVNDCVREVAVREQWWVATSFLTAFARYQLTGDAVDSGCRVAEWLECLTLALKVPESTQLEIKEKHSVSTQREEWAYSLMQVSNLSTWPWELWNSPKCSYKTSQSSFKGHHTKISDASEPYYLWGKLRGVLMVELYRLSSHVVACSEVTLLVYLIYS